MVGEIGDWGVGVAGGENSISQAFHVIPLSACPAPWLSLLQEAK